MERANGLTAAQRRAVEHFEGPLLVLAGPGSGKTRVITHRIARLLQQGVRSDQILALTFTNKAAREMSHRVTHLLGGTNVQVSTFHRFCARLLRLNPEAVGLRQNFTILDHTDQVQLVRSIMKDERLDTSFHDPARVLARISQSRNDLISAETFRRHFDERPGTPLDCVVYEVFGEYEQRVLQQNAVDFDDLLLHVVKIMREDDHVRERLDDQYRFILVDEYQDTNLAQYEIVRAISQRHPNLCATGDPDQSIYGWRGARPENIPNFERDYPDVQIVSLDQNFRSTGSIVHCAEQLISCNPRKHRGALTTANPQGDTVRLLVFDHGDAEADGIAAEIAERVRKGERKYSDFAVFYRVNALSRPLETAFSRHRIPFQVAAGFSFFERAEIRDLIAYLRLIENDADDLAFERIVNRPMRGIGAKSLQRLSSFAVKNQISLFEAAVQAEEIAELSARALGPLKAFVDLIQRLQEVSAEGKAAAVLERLIAEIDYLKIWSEADDEVDVDRVANVHELITSARQYDAMEPLNPEEPNSLQGFLEQACLSSEVDNVDSTNGSVTFMTMHAAKGLEFPAVYIIGLENSLIPHERAVRNGDPASFQEERRLFFVGITRAMQELTLTQTIERTFRGMRRTTISSMFVPEIESAIQRHFDSEAHAEKITESVMDRKLAEARKRFEFAKNQPNRLLLMTGTQLQARSGGHDSDVEGHSGSKREGSQSSAPPSGSQLAANAMVSGLLYHEGMRVRHPRYGTGYVKSVSAFTGKGTVSVVFDLDSREETFVLGKAPLQPLEL
ncbi:MAG: exodeoxyribonuclease V subunit gamma [Planctomycetaceae bacterium]|nr:exodeoxyribonuclease V subunit gamma [Planctomycetaceae bacterium]